MKKISFVIFIISIILYFIGLFIMPFNSVSGKEEIEFIIILIVPCIMLLFCSFSDSKGKKEYILMYLLAYIVALLGVVLSNYRINYATARKIIIRDFNFVPLKSIKELFISEYGIKFALYNIIGNFFMLSPLVLIIPLLNKKLYKCSYLLLICFLTSTLIETVQYVTNIGSFDIDDIILNVLGAMLVYFITRISIIQTLINHVFLESFYKNRFCKIMQIVMLIISTLIIIIYSHNMIQNYFNRKINISTLHCKYKQKTYVISKGNYRYYSSCNYDGSFVYVGKSKYDLKNFIISSYFNEKYEKKLDLVKEKIITDVKVILSENETTKLIYNDTSEDIRYYLVNINDIEYQIDNNPYLINDIFKLDESINVFNVVSLFKYDKKGDISIYKGDYYNIVTCHGTNKISNYIIPTSYVISSGLCQLH